jgi:hypothetical protein
MYTRKSDSAARPSYADSAKGKVALVPGQQSYAIVFGAQFYAPPSFLTAQTQMPSSSGEVFEVTPDLSTLTSTGVTVWLSGIPTAASSGGYINWKAEA